MHLPAMLRTSPTRDEVEGALLTEIGRYADGGRNVPNAWTVWLSTRDARRRDDDLRQWSATLQVRLVDEVRRLGLPTAGFVTVGFGTDPALPGGQFRVSSTDDEAPPLVVLAQEVVPGRPRLVISTGGTAAQGSPAAAGIEREVLLAPGTFVIGRDDDADLRLHDATVSPRHVLLEVTPDGDPVRLRDLGSLNGTSVDGVPTVAFDLVDGSRIELGATTLVFHRDPLDDDGGRQGGEGD